MIAPAAALALALALDSGFLARFSCLCMEIELDAPPAHEYPAYEALLLYFTAASLLLCAHMENQAKCIWQAARAGQARITERNESE